MIAPRHKHRVAARGHWSISLWKRISRNTPATTIVLECKREETGVGPSIAAGSHGWSPNCADFPAAAMIRPTRKGVGFWPSRASTISLICHEVTCPRA